ncbi:hypothetical protein PVAR5_1997 [Paecilomyces variotii No. 5]|uniref:Uncharacterized protein n=1 Tax=Byssochlamys spectabilis (strain No. 5 / NBRC 109023) TaxID=1356009 RepID=V5FXP6_BYSSN|nr:hypothetical protein PVAR5_1997 [Paecilomyces variotii No. 5]
MRLLWQKAVRRQHRAGRDDDPPEIARKSRNANSDPDKAILLHQLTTIASWTRLRRATVLEERDGGTPAVEDGPRVHVDMFLVTTASTATIESH